MFFRGRKKKREQTNWPDENFYYSKMHIHILFVRMCLHEIPAVSWQVGKEPEA